MSIKLHLFCIFFCIYFSAQAQSDWQKAPIPGGNPPLATTSGYGASYLLDATGIYKSTDDGSTWQYQPGTLSIFNLKPPVTWLPINLFAAPGGRLYAMVPGPDPTNSTYYTDYHLYYSNNGGASWTYLRDYFASGNDNKNKFAVKGDTLFGVNGGDLAEYSTDQGQTWKPVMVNGLNLAYVIQIKYFGDRWYALEEGNYLYTSTDLVNWQVIYTFPYIPINGHINRIEPLDEQTIAAKIKLNTNLLISHDIGAHWDTIILPETILAMDFFLAKTNDGLYFQSRDSAALYFTADWGQTWIKRSVEGYAGGGKDRWLVSNGTLISTNSSGVTWSADGGEHFKPSAGLNQAVVRAFNRVGDNWYTATNTGLYVSHNGGQTWTKGFGTPAQPGKQAGQIVTYGDAVMVSTRQAGVYVSKDKGEHWTVQPFDLSDDALGQNLSSSGDGYFYLFANAKMYRSGDGGSNWEALPNFPLPAVKYIDASGKKVVAGDGSQLYISADRGSSWTLLDSPVSIGLAPLQSNARVFDNDLYVFCPTRLYKQTPTGWDLHWQEPTPLPGQDTVPTRSFLYRQQTFLYLGLPGRSMLLSPDDGASWSTVGTLLPASALTSFFADQDLLAGGYNGGLLWKKNTAIPVFGGNVFVDKNSNGSLDPNDLPIPGALVFSQDGQNYATTGTDGQYRFVYNPAVGTTIKTVVPNPYATLASDNLIVSAPGLNYDFAASLPPGIADVALSATDGTKARPGYKYNLVLSCLNQGTVPATAELKFVLQAPFQVVSTLPAANSISGNNYSWNLADLALFGSKQIVLQLLIPADAPDGNTLVGTALAVLGNGTDFNPADNSLDIYSKVEDSYDPNDKAVVPEGNLTPQQIAAGQRLSYTIRFQNTGTASALAVTVIDTLDPQIDWRTFRVIASSHPVKWQMKGSGIVEFSLTDLQLPPATVDETASHGYLQFEVDANTDLVIGDIIRNSAHIYFDYNAPVITNTVSNTVSQVNNTYAADLSSQIVIYPTLVGDALTVENGSLTDLHFEILTTLGQTTGVSGGITGGSNPIRLGHLQKGTYILLLIGKDGRTEKTFFKI